MTTGSAPFADLLRRVEEIVAAAGDPDKKLERVCRLLRDSIAHYDWVGFYRVASSGRHLTLGPYAGEPTEHVCIAFGRGICGQAAERKETFVVQDVLQEPNYLACSPKVRAEMVVPVFREGALWGELDVDSHTLAPFTAEDRAFLEQVAAQISAL